MKNGVTKMVSCCMSATSKCGSRSLRTAMLAAVACFNLAAADLVVDRDMEISTTVDNVSFAGDYTLTVAANASIGLGAVVNDGHNATLRLNGSAAIKWIDGQNGSTTRVEFNGGCLKDGGSWGTGWFKPDATSTIELASIDGNPILITHPNSQWKYLLSGNGRVFTSGAGALEIATAGVHNGTVLYCYLNIGGENFGHTGGTVFRANGTGGFGHIRLNSADQLPMDEIHLGTSNNYKSYLYIDGTSQHANRIISYSGSVITNQSGSAAALIFTNDNSCLDAVCAGPFFNVKMSGSAATDVFTLKTPSLSGVFTVEKGKAVVQAPSGGGGTKLGQLRICEGAQLEIDGVTVTTGIMMNEGGTVTTKNGGSLVVVQNVADGFTLYDTDGAHVAGATEFRKEGAGDIYLAGASCLEASSIHVVEGMAKFTGPSGTTNHWWRWTVKQSATAGGTLSVGPMRLLDMNCDFADGAGKGSSGGGYSAVSAGTHPTAYQPKQYYCTSTDRVTVKNGSDNPQGPSAIWNSSSVFDCTFNSPKPTLSDSSTWITWTYRIANANVTIRGYNLKTQWGAVNNWPRAWSLESSPSGADGTWELMDERVGYAEITQGQQWYNGGGYGVGGNDNHPATKISFDSQIPSLASQGGIPAGCAVRVDRGATLDCSQCAAQQELSALTVDCADGDGVGTLKNVRIAATGTLNLVNVTTLRNEMRLPLVFVDSSIAGSLGGWTVTVNGENKRTYFIGWRDDGIVLFRGSTSIFFR